MSLSCNATAGIIIAVGGNRTKKREEVERRLRKALEEGGLKRMRRKHEAAEKAEAEAEEAEAKTKEVQGDGVIPDATTTTRSITSTSELLDTKNKSDPPQNEVDISERPGPTALSFGPTIPEETSEERRGS
jgi:hypothetical protein